VSGQLEWAAGWLEESPREVRDQLDIVLGDIRDARVVDTACEASTPSFILPR
jgi:hypothetical protein